MQNDSLASKRKKFYGKPEKFLEQLKLSKAVFAHNLKKFGVYSKNFVHFL